MTKCNKNYVEGTTMMIRTATTTTTTTIAITTSSDYITKLCQRLICCFSLLAISDQCSNSAPLANMKDPRTTLPKQISEVENQRNTYVITTVCHIYTITIGMSYLCYYHGMSYLFLLQLNLLLYLFFTQCLREGGDR